MAKKIAKIDAEIMNSLYASELSKSGIKYAGDGPIAPQAMEDHEEYLAILKSVMSESKNDSDANNFIQD